MITLHFQSFSEVYGFLISKTRWRITLNFKNRLNLILLNDFSQWIFFIQKNSIQPNLLVKSFLLKRANIPNGSSYSTVNEFENGIII